MLLKATSSVIVERSYVFMLVELELYCVIVKFKCICVDEGSNEAYSLKVVLKL